MKTLVIGGAGFIGANTIRRLIADGAEVLVVDRCDPQIHGLDVASSPTARDLLGRVKLAVLDGLEIGGVPELWDGVDSVLYLAASTGTGQSMYDVQSYTRNNVSVAAVLAEQLLKRREQIRRVVVSGTRAVYGEGAGQCDVHGRVYPKSRVSARMQGGDFSAHCPSCDRAVQSLPSLESDPTRPASIYGITKLAQEQIVLSTCEAAGIPAVAFRYQNVYGPGQSLRNPYTGILSIFTQLIRNNADINVFEDGNASRDFVYIDDVAEYNVRALAFGGAGVLTLNLGTGVRQTILDVVRELGRALGKPAKFKVSGQFRVGDIRDAAADNALLQTTLGTRAFTGFQAGIDRFIEWVLTQDADAGAEKRYSDSLSHMSRVGLFRSAARTGQTAT